MAGHRVVLVCLKKNEGEDLAGLPRSMHARGGSGELWLHTHIEREGDIRRQIAPRRALFIFGPHFFWNAKLTHAKKEK